MFLLATNKLLVDRQEEINQLTRDKEGIKLCYI